MKAINFEAITIRLQVSGRGGGIEIDLGKIYKKWAGHKMTAYQNYLGGGMLGRILGDCTLKGTNDHKLAEVMRQLKEYFHSLTNHEGNEWEQATFEQNQRRPTSAY